MESRVKFDRVTAMVLGCATALSVIPQDVLGQEVGESVGVYIANDDNRSVTSLKTDAENGDTNAQYTLGTLYTMGAGVPQDEYSAFFWYKRAAEQELLEAQFQLGMMYLEGEGITESEDEALEWIWLAANRGHPRAKEVLEYILNNDFTSGC